MNSVVVFSSGKISSRFWKLYFCSTLPRVSSASPMSRTQLTRGACEWKYETKARAHHIPSREKYTSSQVNLTSTHQCFGLELDIHSIGGSMELIDTTEYHSFSRREREFPTATCNHVNISFPLKDCERCTHTFCAGPNSSPLNAWAIMMESRTPMVKPALTTAGAAASMASSPVACAGGTCQIASTELDLRIYMRFYAGRNNLPLSGG